MSPWRHFEAAVDVKLPQLREFARLLSELDEHYHAQILHNRFWTPPNHSILFFKPGKLSQLIKILPKPMQKKLLFEAKSKGFYWSLEGMTIFWELGWSQFGVRESDFNRALGDLKTYWGFNEGLCCSAYDLIFRSLYGLSISSTKKAPEAKLHFVLEKGCAFLEELARMLRFHENHPLAPKKKLVELRI